MRIRQIIHIMDLLFVAKSSPMDKVCAPKLTFMPFAPCFYPLKLMERGPVSLLGYEQGRFFMGKDQLLSTRYL